MVSSFNSQKIIIRPVVERILRQLSARNRDVIEARFGIARAERETLESIGGRYGITRERVRQIEEATLAKIRSRSDIHTLDPLFEKVNTFFEMRGGIAREEELLSNLVPANQGAHLMLALRLNDNFLRISETDDFHPLWTTRKENAENLHGLLISIASRMHKHGKPLSWNGLLELAKEEAAKHPEPLSPDVVARHLHVSKTIKKGPFENWGLSHWPEINPRGVRDKAYLVLAINNRTPLHFREIAKRIQILPLQENAKKKSAHPQTVHNELIKDERFVLVGRGTYGLLEWGYTPGTVRDVLRSILAEAKKPLSQEELLSRVLKERFVQPNTVLINMQNKKHFRRMQDGKYMLA